MGILDSGEGKQIRYTATNKKSHHTEYIYIYICILRSKAGVGEPLRLGFPEANHCLTYLRPCCEAREDLARSCSELGQSDDFALRCKHRSRKNRRQLF